MRVCIVGAIAANMEYLHVHVFKDSFGSMIVLLNAHGVKC